MFNVQYATDLVWTDADQTNFKCNVKLAEFDEVMPCGVNATDRYAHIKELWTRGLAGEYGPIAPYVAPPEPEPESVAPVQGQPTQTGAEQF